MTQIMFYVFAAIVILSAILVVSLQNLVRSIFLFFVTLFAMAGLYVFAMADFVAVTQVVIYVGGVLVLMLFAFMLSNKDLLNTLKSHKKGILKFHHLPGLLIAGVFLFILISVFTSVDFENLSWIKNSIATNQNIKPTDNTVKAIGIQTMTGFLLPFEIVSIFLMMALIGAAHIARREKRT
ncbi:MAG: NADH-quinone oxidoreductase subunit [Daejeonella sp.]|nr:NADH-quinone oxidoreductase subunit [Daejeonella sp.]